MKDYASRYRCKRCGSEKFIPERPLDCEREVQTGCKQCGTISSHRAVGIR